MRPDMKYRMVAIILACTSLGAVAQVHKCIDAQGKITYSNQDCPASTKEIVQVQEAQAQTNAQRRQTEQANVRRQQQQIAENQRKTAEHSQMAQQATRRTSYGHSTKDINQCEKWQREEKIVRNLVKPEPGRLQRAIQMVDRYC